MESASKPKAERTDRRLPATLAPAVAPVADGELIHHEDKARTRMKTHPLANLFPMMTDEELADLAADIKTNGLVHPIIKDVIDGEDTLIDGRNRFKACQMAGVAPRFEGLNGRDPVALILSSNAVRRQMTKKQIAVVCAKAFPEPAKVKRAGCSEAEHQFPMVSKGKLSEAAPF